MPQLPFFTWHNILCAVVGRRVVRSVFHACRFSLTLRHTEPSSVCIVAEHNNMWYTRQHGVRSARLPRFGEIFQWRKSSVCCFGALLCNFGASRRQLHLRRRLLRSRRQQMAAVNFVHFYFVKWFVKMDRKITSNIRFEKI